MKINIRTLFKVSSAIVAVFLIPLGSAQGGGDPASGYWQLNLGKSTVQGPAPRAERRVQTLENGMFNLTASGTGPDGKNYYTVYAGRTDGKDYPVSGHPLGDTFNLMPSGPTSYAAVIKSKGKVVRTAESFWSADGRTQTLTFYTHDDTGKRSAASLMVYDRVDPLEGDWVLNLAKSTYQTTAPKRLAYSYRWKDDTLEFSSSGETPSGALILGRFSAKVDGREYPQTGLGGPSTVALTRDAKGMVVSTQRIDGRVNNVISRSFSADGNTMTLSAEVTRSDGSKARNVLVMDRAW